MPLKLTWLFFRKSFLFRPQRTDTLKAVGLFIIRTGLLTETFRPISLIFASFKCNKISGVVVYTCNPSTWEREKQARG